MAGWKPLLPIYTVFSVLQLLFFHKGPKGPLFYVIDFF